VRSRTSGSASVQSSAALRRMVVVQRSDQTCSTAGVACADAAVVGRVEGTAAGVARADAAAAAEVRGDSRARSICAEPSVSEDMCWRACLCQVTCYKPRELPRQCQQTCQQKGGRARAAER